MPFVTGDKIAILNVYDSCITLTDAPTHFSEYVVNGVTYTSVDTLQASLLDVIYTRLSLGTISGTGTVTNVSLSLGSTGTDVNGGVASPTTTPIITLNIPTASATNRGVLSALDWSTFNGKQDALGFTPYDATNPAGYITSAALSGYLPLSGGTLASSGSSNTLNINHTSGSGIALNILKNGNGEGLTIVKGSGSGNAASITGGITLLSELNLTTKLADAHINSAATWNAKIGGSGTTNYLAKFTASGVVGNSQIFDNGSFVGIGTIAPEEKLHVNTGRILCSVTTAGSAYFRAKNTLGDTFFGNDSTGGYISTGWNAPILFYLNNIEQLRIAANGNLLIGTTTDAGFKLDVNGTFRATSLIKSGGTSSQFLKADGSVDSSAYITGLSWAGLTGKPTTISGFGITDAVSNVQGVQGAWTGTQAQYDAIATKSSTTIYFIQ
jgi:hypothetical protein